MASDTAPNTSLLLLLIYSFAVLFLVGSIHTGPTILWHELQKHLGNEDFSAGTNVGDLVDEVAAEDEEVSVEEESSAWPELPTWQTPFSDKHFLKENRLPSRKSSRKKDAPPKGFDTTPAFSQYHAKHGGTALSSWILGVARRMSSSGEATETKNDSSSPNETASEGAADDSSTGSSKISDHQDMRQSLWAEIGQLNLLGENHNSVQDLMDLLMNSGKEVVRQMNETFGDVGLELFNPLQFMYFLQHEEQTKNSVWKRRMHRFMPHLTVDDAIQLYDGLFLSQLAYAQSCAIIQSFLEQKFQQGLWSLRNCTVEAQPNQPAHFLAVQKIDFEPEREGFLSFLMGPSRHVHNLPPLEAALVIRGTKQLSDILTDGMLEATEYQTSSGRAHTGILQAAKWLADAYRADLKKLLKRSGRKTMNLWLLGHSLGAGTAALACIELREKDSRWLNAKSVGFGTPAVVDPQLSSQYREHITTVVNDADVVPRMSGASMTNAWLRVMAFNFTDASLEDFDHVAFHLLKDKDDFGVIQFLLDKLRTWLEGLFETTVTPVLLNLPAIEQKEAELIPPGECVHLYRDGRSWQGSYMNCSFFREVELVEHLVDDHLIPSGYHQGLLGFVRSKTGDSSWGFGLNAVEIPVEG